MNAASRFDSSIDRKKDPCNERFSRGDISGTPLPDASKHRRFNRIGRLAHGALVGGAMTLPETAKRRRTLAWYSPRGARRGLALACLAILFWLGWLSGYSQAMKAEPPHNTLPKRTHIKPFV